MKQVMVKQVMVCKIQLEEEEKAKIYALPDHLCEFFDCKGADCGHCPFDVLDDRYNSVIEDIREIMDSLIE